MPPAKASPVNATAAALLGLLHDGPMTGGQLVAAAGDQYGSFFSVTRSQVYRELPGLAEAGLLKLGKQGPRASQQYAITAAGTTSNSQNACGNANRTVRGSSENGSAARRSRGAATRTRPRPTPAHSPPAHLPTSNVGQS